MIDELRKLFAPKPTSDMSGFRFADLFDNNRWETRKKAMEDVAPDRQGDDVYYRQYVPRPSAAPALTSDPSVHADAAPEGYDFKLPLAGGAEINVVPPSGADRRHYERSQGTTVKRVTSPEGVVTTTETTKYVPMDDNSYWRKEHRGYEPLEFGPTRTTGNPFGYPMHTAIQGPPRYTDVYQEMRGATPMMPISNYSLSPYGYTPIEMPSAPPISGIGTTHGRMPIFGSRITPSVPSGLHPGWETGYGMASPQYGYTTTGAITPFEPAPQSMLDRFPNSPVGMSDAVRRRMLELILTDPSIILERSN